MTKWLEFIGFGEGGILYVTEDDGPNNTGENWSQLTNRKTGSFAPIFSA